ncbi:CD63 antigen-like isoform X2 [Odontomachus brunneus]|uniref:CD63 antigen-like isoform X2 n=1 Tax=Odontomachus brunneus TaxID=486640 RepID=UPI0013F194B4|nr:CD63 antigen-like isoform X2 [Odontomachus brunneus]
MTIYLCGLAILTMGVVVHRILTHYADANKETEGPLDEKMCPWISLIVIGSIIFVIAFFGCCGAIRESYCMTLTFAFLLSTILIIQTAFTIYTFVVRNSDEIEASIRKTYIDEIFNKFNRDQKSTGLMNDIQAVVGCCGVDSYRDFTDNGNTIPFSCCDDLKESTCTPNNASKKGCVQVLQKRFKDMRTTVGTVALGTAVVELIGFIFALRLANSIKNEQRRCTSKRLSDETIDKMINIEIIR